MGIMAFMGMMGLAGCSGNEVEGPQADQTISFAGSLTEGKAVSRAERGLEELLTNKSFKAWGYKNTAVSGSDYTDYQAVMLGYTVNWASNTANTTESNTHDWEYVGQAAGQSIKYWDFSAKAYRFFAYALGNGTAAAVTADTSDDTQVSFTSSVNGSDDASIEAAPYFSELWFSSDKTNAYGKAVTLRFLKPFARVRFMFLISPDLTIDRSALSKIKFHPTPSGGTTPTIATAGNVTVSYPLKGTETKETWSSAASSGIAAFTEDEKWYYVLPAPSQGSYTIEVAVETDEVKTATVPATYMSWKTGYEYTYVFKITETGGLTIDVIEVAVNDWTDKGVVNHEVYNW
ncbi:MAG: fimbrillin family protein [Bacteroidaceae bacterium]|nr:fimbrillin family protein [Bacteroidaceae bacterium]